MDHLDDQETLAAFKAWWSQWGVWIIGLLLVMIIAAAGWNGWQYWQRTQTAKAAILYEQLQEVFAGSTDPAHPIDQPKLKRIVSDLERLFPRTPYSQMGALLAAKAWYQAGSISIAKEQLQWASQRGEPALQAIARLRLAGLLLDEKSYSAGLAQLDNVPTKSDRFQALFAERRGDLFAAQGQKDKAKQAYRKALKATPYTDALYEMIQLKLDGVGS